MFTTLRGLNCCPDLTNTDGWERWNTVFIENVGWARILAQVCLILKSKLSPNSPWTVNSTEGHGNLTLGSKEDLVWAPHLWQRCWKGERVSSGACSVAQLCPTLSDPMDCNPAGLLSPWGFPVKAMGVGCHALPRCSSAFHHNPPATVSGLSFVWPQSSASHRAETPFPLPPKKD